MTKAPASARRKWLVGQRGAAARHNPAMVPYWEAELTKQMLEDEITHALPVLTDEQKEELAKLLSNVED